MPLKFSSGDMFKGDFDIMVNTVNCVGAMGKGVALEFKKRCPSMFEDYVKYCKLGQMFPGEVYPYITKTGILILNVATKDHWREKSKMTWISHGTDAIAAAIYRSPISSKIAIPALGCGNGGLDWAKVKHFLQKRFQDLPHKITVFAPRRS